MKKINTTTIILLLASLVFIFMPLGSNAQGPEVPVGDYLQRFLQQSDNQKEFTLDTVAFSVANTAINSLTGSVVDWINSGFEGNPAFVTDLGSFQNNIQDEVLSNFIQGTALDFLCSPYQTPIKRLLVINQSRHTNSFSNKVQCNLDNYVDSIQSFIDGDFESGGWDGWFAFTQNSSNNPIGAFLDASEELSNRTNFATENALTELDWGNGLFSIKQCQGEGDTETCEIVTPGAVVEGQLNNVLGSNTRRLEVADEFNEIVSALANQLLNQVLSSSGLLGTSRSSSSGSSSYIEELLNSETELEVAEPIDINLNQFQNIALNKRTRQSGQWKDARSELAVDGNTSSNNRAQSVAITDEVLNPWWEVDLGEISNIDEVEIHRSTHRVSSESAVGSFKMLVSHNPFLSNFNPNNPATWQAGTYLADTLSMPSSGPLTVSIQNTGQYIRIQRIENEFNRLYLAEVKVFEEPDSEE